MFPIFYTESMGVNFIDPKWSPVQRGRWCHRFHANHVQTVVVFFGRVVWPALLCNFVVNFFKETLRVHSAGESLWWSLGWSPTQDQWKVKSTCDLLEIPGKLFVLGGLNCWTFHNKKKALFQSKKGGHLGSRYIFHPPSLKQQLLWWSNPWGWTDRRTDWLWTHAENESDESVCGAKSFFWRDRWG